MHTYSIVRLAALHLRKILKTLDLMTVAALDLDKLVAGAFEALRVGRNPTLLRDLVACVHLLLLAEVGGIVVPQARVALELCREEKAPKTGGCQ